MYKIRGLRVMAGFSQADIAEKFGISAQSYSKKERGITAFTDNEKIIFTNLISEVVPNETIESIFFEHIKTK
ncbi:helix-turn-helix domain-containing protein [Vagococcus lutrae]|uniref:helix-turn-helix domain-containing protein n=1 Tax=Vagococcus lutrae TaxID=81947 RepID=UPI001C951A8E|nr:helix-turn-helix domain-containing protein [Vagococcus lutrae]QZN88059.1 helix-turn-helix domain-containing protein [Vagococcus lutrae]